MDNTSIMLMDDSNKYEHFVKLQYIQFPSHDRAIKKQHG